MTSHVFEHANQLELFKQAHADGIEKAFWEYHFDNPNVYQLLVRFAREAKSAGRRRFGMKAIFERVRWFTEIETRDATGLKLNNNLTSRYSRLIESQERCTATCQGCDNANCLAGLFETRELKTPSDLKDAA